jgi:hypothetical protein
MNPPKAYGTFEKRGDNTFRTSAFIKWGESEKSIGACLLLNPGSANFDMNSALYNSLQTLGHAKGEIHTDPTMRQLIQLLEGIYGADHPLNGHFHIYNLFTLQNTASSHAIDQFENLANHGEYDISESLVILKELQSHPWILLGWSVEQNSRWKNLELTKDLWRRQICESKVPTFGKKHINRDDYYHPCPLIPTQRPTTLTELITLYKQKFKKQRFPVNATKPNLLIDPKPVEDSNELDYGWSKSPANPESIVRGFSHLRIKNGFKLRAYQYTDGTNGNRVMWAIPVDKDLPDPEECEHSDDHFLSGPKPSFALDDFMQAIEGDKTPLSYLQASVLFHELKEFGARWHGTSWGRDVILPLNEGQKAHFDYCEWEMLKDEPEIIEPHFYYSCEGNPIAVFHTINDIGTVTLNRYVHTFNKDDYTMQVQLTCIATAGGGIIF